MATHIAYDTDKRIIYVTSAPVNGEISLDVEIDLYSDMKEDWLTNSTLGKFKLPITSVGGNALPGDKSLGSTFFLDSLWKIRPYEANHKFNLSGNLFSEDGTSIMIPTIGSYQVLSEMFVSNLTDSTVVENPIDEQLDYNGIIQFDETDGYAGTEYPIGTTAQPVNNINDLLILTETYHIHEINVHSNLTLDRDIEKFIIRGRIPKLIFNPNGFKAHLCKFNELMLNGNFNDSLIKADDCSIIEALNVYGAINNSYHVGRILIAANQNLNRDNCQSGIAGLGSPITDMNAGEDTTFSDRAFSGGHTVINCDTPACVATLSFQDGGKPHIEPSCTDGLLSIRGQGALDDRSGIGCEVERSAWIESGDIDNISYIEKWIYINTELGTNGNGKESTPFNNISDAVDFAENKGWHKLMFLAGATLERTLKNFTIEGIGIPTIDFNGQNVDKSEFSKVKLTGQQVGVITAREVVMLAGLTGVNGVYKEFGLAGDIAMADNSYSTFASISGLFLTTPTAYKIDFGAGNTNVVLNVRKASGAFEIENVNTATKFATFEFNGGKFIAGISNTDGVIGVAGLPDSAVDIDLATSTKIVDGLFPSANSITNDVWNEEMIDHKVSKTFGDHIRRLKYNKV